MLKKSNYLFIVFSALLILLIILMMLGNNVNLFEGLNKLFSYLNGIANKFKDNLILLKNNLNSPSIFPLVANSFILSFCFVVVSFLVILTITYFILGKQSKLKGDIYELQKISKFKVLWLNLLFFVLLFFIVLLSYSLILNSLIIINYKIKNHTFFIILSLISSVFIFFAILFAYLIKASDMKNESIDKLAKILEAREISPTRKNLTIKERNAFFAIEEMAIASNMPIPRVFIMLKEKGINALCTGEKFGKKDEKIAIFITKGALDFFNKEELQAVIGHEFSHAFHKDVVLNLKLFSLIFSLNCIYLAGDLILRTSKEISKARRSKSNDSILNIVGAIAFVLYVLGSLGTFFARVLQASISRQKEYLADVTSVQYTRNPQALINALKKLMMFQNKTNIDNVKAKDCAHMFFLKAFDGIFATHPSLEKRIKYLEKHFGKF
ncbi:M48 family metalloprotease [Campylobacter jejuni]|uniref:M48 family metalloprotease n=1 Tax=Campylobacter jejuni TaxID=197 RepID=UPI0011A0D175|nr:M48 family metalloprotease [Campylobacter jejuni]